MRILTVGWHGQVTHAISNLLGTRSDVTAYAVGRGARDLAAVPGVARVMFDIEPDVIINVSAYTNVDGAEGEPEKASMHNASGAAGLAAEAARRGIPIIHLSTVYVFDGRSDRPYTEADPPCPINEYGRSKWEAERALAKANSRHIILRTAWIYSQFGTNFVRSILRRARSESEIDVVGDQYGSPTSAVDLADAILRIARNVTEGPSTARWGTYHIAGAGRASWFDIATHALEVSDTLGGPSATIHRIDSDKYPTRALRLANSELDCTKLHRVFGVRLPEWKTGVERCVRQCVQANS